MDITFVTNANTDNEALVLLKELGLPFKGNNSHNKIKNEIKEDKIVENDSVLVDKEKNTVEENEVNVQDTLNKDKIE